MGFLSGVGGMINDVLGGTASAKQQHKYNKEYAQNAHQWEVADLQKAGLNPAISANSGSASSIAGSSVGSSTNGNIGDLVSMGTNLISALSQKKLNDAISAKTEAERASILGNLKYLPKEKQAQLNNLAADTLLKQEQSKETNERTAKMKQGLKGTIMGTESLDSPIGFLGSIFNGKKDKRKKH